MLALGVLTDVPLIAVHWGDVESCSCNPKPYLLIKQLSLVCVQPIVSIRCLQWQTDFHLYNRDSTVCWEPPFCESRWLPKIRKQLQWLSTVVATNTSMKFTVVLLLLQYTSASAMPNLPRKGATSRVAPRKQNHSLPPSTNGAKKGPLEAVKSATVLQYNGSVIMTEPVSLYSLTLA